VGSIPRISTVFLQERCTYKRRFVVSAATRQEPDSALTSLAPASTIRVKSHRCWRPSRRSLRGHAYGNLKA
jgi:hypothetical protein